MYLPLLFHSLDTRKTHSTVFGLSTAHKAQNILFYTPKKCRSIFIPDHVFGLGSTCMFPFQELNNVIKVYRMSFGIPKLFNSLSYSIGTNLHITSIIPLMMVLMIASIPSSIFRLKDTMADVLSKPVSERRE